MFSESLFRRLRDAADPLPGAKERVQRRIQGAISVPRALPMAREALTPSVEQQQRIWAQIHRQITSPAAGVLGGIRDSFIAPQATFLPSFAQFRLAPERRAHPFFRWGAALAVLALLAPIAPALFIGPSTVARATIVMRPMNGDVYVVNANTLEPLTEEREMQREVQLQTGDDGAVTVAAYDDYVVRLDHDTDAQWYDLTDRPEPTLGGPTLALRSGRLWIQGLVPSHVRGITVATPAGDVVLQEGSADIAVNANESVTVRVFDRTATIVHAGRTLILAAGEVAAFSRHMLPTAQEIRISAYGDAWVTRNIGYDAVHRKEIAQWQQERRAAQAGILPTSPLYTAKRALEKVAEFTSFTNEGLVQQKLAQADTRLNEAAALMQEGDAENASLSLEEYRTTLLALATGTGGDSVTQFLIRQKIAEDTAGLSAASPDEDSYVLKQTALEAGASLPEQVLPADVVHDVLLVDRLAGLDEAIVNGDIHRATALYEELPPFEQDGNAIAPVVQRQAQAVLRRYAVALRAADIADEALLQQTAEYLPVVHASPIPLSIREISAIVGGILDRTVGIYKTERGLANSFTLELRQLKGHPDEPRILEQLYLNVQNNELLAPYVRWRIRELREERMRTEEAAQ